MAVAGNEPRSYSFTSTYSTTGDDASKPSMKISAFGKDTEVYVDGVKIAYDDMKDINPKEIQSMSISKSTGKKTIIKIQKNLNKRLRRQPFSNTKPMKFTITFYCALVL